MFRTPSSSISRPAPREICRRRPEARTGDHPVQGDARACRGQRAERRRCGHGLGSEQVEHALFELRRVADPGPFLVTVFQDARSIDTVGGDSMASNEKLELQLAVGGDTAPHWWLPGEPAACPRRILPDSLMGSYPR